MFTCGRVFFTYSDDDTDEAINTQRSPETKRSQTMKLLYASNPDVLNFNEIVEVRWTDAWLNGDNTWDKSISGDEPELI